MKKILFILSFMLLFISFDTKAQKNNYIVTSTMALKLGQFCLSNRSAYAICCSVLQRKGVNSLKDMDIIMRSFGNHLNYAEAFIITLYSSFGDEMSYFTLKDWFTIEEIKKAELIWSKEKIARDRKNATEERAKEKREAIEELARKKEQAIFEIARKKEQDIEDKSEKDRQINHNATINEKLAKEGYIFSFVEVDQGIVFDFDHVLKNNYYLKSTDSICFAENIIVDKNGHLSIEIPDDTIKFNKANKEFIKELGKAKHTPANVLIYGVEKKDVKRIDVNSKIKLLVNNIDGENLVKELNSINLVKQKEYPYFSIQHYRYDGYESLSNEDEINLNKIVQKMNTTPSLQSLTNGRYEAEIAIYDRYLSVIDNLEGKSKKIKMSSKYKVSYRKINVFAQNPYKDIFLFE